METIRLKKRQIPNNNSNMPPERPILKQKSGAGLMWLSMLSTLIKWGSAAAFIYALLWCLNHFNILSRILWVSE